MSHGEFRVAVVGAGVSGLACALEFERRGVRVDVFEASPLVGGRVQTDDVEGYQLDRGFQILIDAYPEVRKQLDMAALKLKAFAPGAVLMLGGQASVLAHPLKRPQALLQTIRTACSWGLLTSATDVLRLLGVVSGWLCSGPYSALERPGPAETTDLYLKGLGLSEAMRQRFLRPFFEAIYVSPLEQQSSALFQFVLRMLALGNACLPERGMRAVPEQLASRLRRPVLLSTPVDEVKPKAVKVQGSWREYDAVVVAAEWPAAARLLRLPAVAGTSSATWYFGLPAPAPVQEPLIVLQSYGEETAGGSPSRIVNIGFPSVVQASYAPPGRALAAVTVMGPRTTEQWVRQEVERVLGSSTSTWALLRSYEIEYHNAAQVPTARGPVPQEVEGVFCCGEHCRNPTLDGAMISGRLAAELTCKSLP